MEEVVVPFSDMHLEKEFSFLFFDFYLKRQFVLQRIHHH